MPTVIMAEPIIVIDDSDEDAPPVVSRKRSRKPKRFKRAVLRLKMVTTEADADAGVTERERLDNAIHSLSVAPTRQNVAVFLHTLHTDLQHPVDMIDLHTVESMFHLILQCAVDRAMLRHFASWRGLLRIHVKGRAVQLPFASILQGICTNVVHFYEARYQALTTEFNELQRRLFVFARNTNANEPVYVLRCKDLFSTESVVPLVAQLGRHLKVVLPIPVLIRALDVPSDARAACDAPAESLMSRGFANVDLELAGAIISGWEASQYRVKLGDAQRTDDMITGMLAIAHRWQEFGDLPVDTFGDTFRQAFAAQLRPICQHRFAIVKRAAARLEGQLPSRLLWYTRFAPILVRCPIRFDLIIDPTRTRNDRVAQAVTVFRFEQSFAAAIIRGNERIPAAWTLIIQRILASQLHATEFVDMILSFVWKPVTFACFLRHRQTNESAQLLQSQPAFC